jgi:hypothetical protein
MVNLVSEHGEQYAEALVDLARERDIENFVEVGVGIGGTCVPIAQVLPISVLAVDMFGRDENQLAKFHSHCMDVPNLIPLKAPGEFPVASFEKRSVHMFHLDIIEIGQANEKQQIRFMLNQWLPKVVNLVVPRMPSYETVVRALGEQWHVLPNEHLILCCRKGLFRGST